MASNDNIAAAVDLGSSWTGVSADPVGTTGATLEPGEQYLSSFYQRTVWYTWTAPSASAPNTIDTIQFVMDDGSFPNAFLAVYQLMPWAADVIGSSTWYQALTRIAQGFGQPFRVEPGRTYYVQVSTPGEVVLAHLSWSPSYTYTVGPWIERGEIEIAGSVQTDSGVWPVVDVRRSGREADWVADQAFGGPVAAYDYPFARECAFEHCLAGDLLGHYSGYDFSMLCPVGHFNDARQRDNLVGMQEVWDLGLPFVAAFYDMYMWQLPLDISVLGAIRAWLPGPTPLLPPQEQGDVVTETEADPAWNGNLYSDQFNPDVRFDNEVVDYSFVVTPTGAMSLSHGFTMQVRHWYDPVHHLLAVKGPQTFAGSGFFDPPHTEIAYLWFTPADLGGHTILDDAVSVVTLDTTFPDQVLRGVASDLKSPDPSNDTTTDPWYSPHRSRDLFILAPSFMLDEVPPGKIGTATDEPLQRDDYIGVTNKPNSGVVTVVQPRYRYLYRNPPLPDITQAPGAVNVKYNPIRAVSLTS